MKTSNVVIIGASIAGHSVAVGIKEKCPDATVTVVTQENCALYDRRKLFAFLCGDVKEKDLMLVNTDFYEKRGIKFLKDHKVSSVGAVRRQVSCRHKDARVALDYDYLVICSGRSTVMPEIEGIHKEGVYQLNSLADYKTLKTHLLTDPVCLIGEAEYGVVLAGMLQGKQREVKLIRSSEPAGFNASATCELVRSDVVELIGESGIQAIRLKEGKIIGTSLPVFIPAQTRPSIDFAKDIGLTVVDDFVAVDEKNQTTVADVYACGSVCRRLGVSGVAKDWDSVAQEGAFVADTIAAAIAQGS
jgi:NAD(P)H-nitrite reductase large subunit